LWQLDKVPTSLFGDELDVGYQAYSILHTGRDYYGNFMPLHFHSLAEWRTPLYLYSVVPTVALFGISPLGVRLPAAIFGIAGVAAMYLLVRKIRIDYLEIKNYKLELVASLLLAISPWHIQYSRAAFEVTEMIFFLLLGLYLFFVSIKGNGRWLWVSLASFLLMSWTYSTAKVFTPIFLSALFLLYRKKIFTLPRKQLIYSIITGLILGVPLLYSILLGGGSQRFGYIGVFSDPTTETQIGAVRQQLALSRGESGFGLEPSFSDRIFHNKFTVWGDKVFKNYFQSFSTDFLFNNGDINPRHSITGQGQLYRVEVITLIIGLIYFFRSKIDKRFKTLIVVWLLGGVLPAALTRDGGNHATRLILILPVLIFLISYGIVSLSKIIPKRLAKVALVTYYLLLLTCFAFYQHNYWNIYPWGSERWWHYGWQETIQSMKEVEGNYDRIIISTSDEPPWIFFAASYQYPPADWQENFPLGNDVELSGIGKVSHIHQFYFGSPEEGGVYDWGKVLTDKDLYVASAKEVNVNLIIEPERTPNDLNLVKAIAYPSGEPAFYLFSGKNEN